MGLSVVGGSLVEDAEDVVFANDEALFAVDLHFRAAVLAEEHAVADFNVQLANGTVLLDLAVADSDHFSLDRLLFRRVRDDDATLALLLFLDALDDDAILQRANLAHVSLLLVGGRSDGSAPR